MPRPTIVGTIIRDVKLYCGVNGHDKEYRVVMTSDGQGRYRVFYEHGPAGKMNQGGEKTAAPVSRATADSILTTLVQEKEGKRYDITSDRRFAEPPQPAPTAAPLAQKAKTPRPKKVKPKAALATLPETARAGLTVLF